MLLPMKTKYPYIAIMFLLLFSFGCTKEEGIQMTAIDMSFSPAIISNTRASEGTYPQDTPFDVWAYYLPQGKKWSNHHQDAQSLTNKHQVQYSSNEWLPTPAMKWPGKDDVTFMASSPQNIDAHCFSEKGITIQNFDAGSGVLPLFTEPVADCNVYNTHGCVALPFIHALSKIELEARSVDYTDSIIRLKHLFVDEIKYKGSFHSLPTPNWIPDEETMRVSFCQKEILVGRVAVPVGYRMLMGQYGNYPVVLVVDILDKEGNTVVEDRKIKASLVSDGWYPGKYYKYTLNLTTVSVTIETDILERFNI